MSRPNVQVQLQNISVLMRRLGYGTAYSTLPGVDSNGNDCIRFDWTAANWATTNLTVVIRAISNQVSGIVQTPSWMTPSVVQGQYSNGVFSYEIGIEDVPLATNAGANEKFMADIIHVLRSMQSGNSVNLWKTATGTQPILGGFNGPSDVLGTFVGTLLPGSRIAAGGYGS